MHQSKTEKSAKNCVFRCIVHSKPPSLRTLYFTIEKAMFEDLLEQLEIQQTGQVDILKEISAFSTHDVYPEIIESLKGNNTILSVTAKVLIENFNEWSADFPDWLEKLAVVVSKYQRLGSIKYPYDQVKELISSYWQYLQHEHWGALISFGIFTNCDNARQILLHENEIYNSIKKAVNYHGALHCILNCAAAFDPWKQKILEDSDFVTLVSTLQVPLVWNLLESVALHPDAKMLMPNEVVVLAGKSKVVSATNLYALLCNDNDLASIALEPNYIEALSNALDDILLVGRGVLDGATRLLLSLLRPIANISIADSYKDIFGEKMLVNLLAIVCDKMLDSSAITTNLPQSRAMAAKTLWNLAYLKENCVRIHEANGIERLTTTKETTDDQELKRNIEGILYMCNTALQEDNGIENAKVENNKVEEAPQATSEAPARVHVEAARKGHVMISYNWDNQPIVKQIAQSLKDHGYNVWLDIEQMGGSTLEAMALAIEQSEMVLICMSQKYKDSPNCRLEGEYCVNKKVPFVPLMMQQGYSPDGWLGITLGAKLWYDFTNDNNWDSKLQGLTKAIGDHGKILKANSTVEPSVNVPKSTSPSPKVWTAEDMLNWIRGENIKHPEELFELLSKHDVDQQALVELKYLLADPQMPAFIKFNHFQSICKEMGIGKIGTALHLASAIRKL